MVLRGQEPGPALDEEDVEEEQKEGEGRREDRGGAGRVDRIKRRRIAGEDDTDRDIRVAREIAGLDAVAGGDREREFKVRSAGAGADAALLDAQGHTILFPMDEQKKPQTESKDITVKPDQRRLYDEKDAWYASSIGDISSRDIPLNKDVWGNEDPRRQERSQRRMASADPLMAIKRGVGQLRETERARKKIEEERRRELEALRREQDDEVYRSRRRRERSASPDGSRSRDGERSRHRHRHRHGHRDGSRHRHHEHGHSHREHDRDRGDRHSSSSHHRSSHHHRSRSER